MEKTKIGLTSFHIKIIALIIMTIDHLAAYEIFTVSNEINIPMRMIGRIAAPLFLFLLVEGLRHTRNKKNYIVRLYIAGAITQLLMEIFPLIFSALKTSISIGNILPTFFYTALYIMCVENIIKNNKKIKNIVISIIFMIVPMFFMFVHWCFINLNTGISGGFYTSVKIILNVVIPSPFALEYSFFFVLLGVIWYFVKNKYINCAIFIVLSVVSRIVDYRVFYGEFFTSNGFTFWQLFVTYQWMMIAAVVFMLLYSGEKGKGGLKYFFYIYYPLHQFILLFFSVYILKR
jgi:hypothetical protein